MHPWIIAAILGLVEGLTEFLPVSSTGHLLIAEHWLGEQSQLFNVVIQPAAALALLPIFWTKLTRIALNFSDSKNRDLVNKLFVAFLITIAGYFIAKKLHLIADKPEHPDAAYRAAKFSLVAWATLIGGVIIIGIELLNKGRGMTNQVSWAIVIAFGFGQLIAIAFPGASRSGTTIMMAMALGLGRSAATEFSFLLGIPTLFGAGAYELLKEFKKPHVDLDWTALGIGSIFSCVSAFLVVKWLIGFVRTHSFTGLALYRILLGTGLLVAFARGWLT